MAKYILFDTETTGKETEDRIIQIGAMVIDGKGAVEVFNDLCTPPLPIKIEAMEVHNLTPEMLEGKPLYSATAFAKMLNELNTPENCLIAHNLPFDLAMIQKEGFVPNIQLIDTLRCAKHLLKDTPHHRLQYFRYSLDLYKHEQEEADKYGIVIKAHDAIGDVLVMKLLLSKLVAEAKALYPDTNPIKTLVELTKTPVFIETLKFGKYKDRKLAEIVNEDSGYIRWMRNNMDLDEDLTYTLDKLEGK